MNWVPNTTIFLSEEFSRTAIEPRRNQYRILHLTTHAEFRPGHPIDSYILLGDGDRTTLFDLDQWNLSNVDLVVLSACRTGISSSVSSEELGTGEEILGFGYQVQRTGARAWGDRLPLGSQRWWHSSLDECLLRCPQQWLQ